MRKLIRKLDGCQVTPRVTRTSGEYQVFEAPYIRIKMYCPRCKKWVVPDNLSLGKAHIYATHCGISQDVGCVWFKEEKQNR